MKKELKRKIKKNREMFIKQALQKGITFEQVESWLKDEKKLSIINAICA